MDQISYHVNLHSHNRLVTKTYSVDVPSGFKIPDANFDQNLDVTRKFVKKLFESHLEKLHREAGPFTCVVCGRKANLYRNLPLVSSSKLAVRDTISAICKQGKC